MLLGASLTGCDPQTSGALKPDPVDRPHGGGNYIQTNLVSDTGVDNTTTDANLVNPWGLAFGPTTPAWVADNGTGYSTIYDGNGVAQSLIVTLPLPPGSSEPHSKPTGLVYNGGDGFVITDGTNSGPARFIFATEEGTIIGWSPAVPPPPPSTNGFIAVPPTGAIYKGLALAGQGDSARLFATDFHNGEIDVFDSSFAPVDTTGQFIDPNLPDDFAPFGIANIGGLIFVTYAMQDAAGEDDMPGPGLGYVDIYSQSGALIRRLISEGDLNAPWGLAKAPAKFGRFSNKLLVGNFGDGKIHAYNIQTGVSQGTLQQDDGSPIVIDGLWALVFGNGAHDQPKTSLFFTAGPVDESHGLYGKIESAHPQSGSDNEQGDDDQGGDDQG
jgi:uncharacterized protein (TIGR03118 family)